MRTAAVLAMVAMLVVGGCTQVDTDDAGAKTEQSRQTVDADFAMAAKVIGMPGEVSRSWGVCMSSPTDAVDYSRTSFIKGDAFALFDTLRDRLETAGWKAGKEENNDGLLTVTLRRDGMALGLRTTTPGVVWGLTGECIRVPSDLSEDLLAE